MQHPKPFACLLGLAMLLPATGSPAYAQPDVRRAGDVAVIVDDGTIVTRARPFDMANSTLTFKPKKNRFKWKWENKNRFVKPQRFDEYGSSQEVILGSYDSRRFDLVGWSFPFYGESYDTVWVNSNGNLSLLGPFPDVLWNRDLILELGGPIILPLFTDLNPQGTSAKVFVETRRRRLRITWENVPLFSPYPSLDDSLNTFQVTLFADGRIVFAYDHVTAVDPIVGLLPELLLSELGFPEPNDDLDEVDFGGTSVCGQECTARSKSRGRGGRGGLLDLIGFLVSDQDLIDAFAGSFDDRDVTLIAFTDLGAEMDRGNYFLSGREHEPGSPARELYYWLDPLWLEFEDATQLKHLVMMRELDRWADDPARPIFGNWSALHLMADGVGHRWDAALYYCLELTAWNEHWLFEVHTGGSVRGGNDIYDNGDGSFTTLVVNDFHYSELDQYLMGLRPKEDVEDFFVVEQADTPEFGYQYWPNSNFTFTGKRKEWSIDDVISCLSDDDSEWEAPDWESSPKIFPMAFALLTLHEKPSEELIAKVDRYRRAFESYFFEATDGLGTVDTTLVEKGEF